MLRCLSTSPKASDKKIITDSKIKKSIGSDGLSYRKDVEVRRRFLRKLESHYPKNSTLKQTLTVIVSLISANPDWRYARTLDPVVNGFPHTVASRTMAEESTPSEVVEKKFVCLEI
jgi:hypothetical protein